MMTHEEMQTLLSKPNNAIVGVNRTEGVPQLTPVWFHWDGTSFYFSTTKDRARYLNLKRDPALSLIVDDLESHKYVVAYGKAEIIEHDFAELARQVIQRYAPPERAEHMIQMTVNDPQRVIVVLHPDK
ncbi:MAG TPA: TIGR03618 family F420-dependent PPOX class oxidoreductase, partial [Ktedonobacteraceae bacterium]|nr:TIGR03618 family F420-dependent PPOX class oxidoreductase [Ktedonobacteraceae bacterium]